MAGITWLFKHAFLDAPDDRLWSPANLQPAIDQVKTHWPTLSEEFRRTHLHVVGLEFGPVIVPTLVGTMKKIVLVEASEALPFGKNYSDCLARDDGAFLWVVTKRNGKLLRCELGIVDIPTIGK